jgi:hypothetical protein
MQTHFTNTINIDGRDVPVTIARLTRGQAIPFFTRFRHLRERTARTIAQREALTLALADDAQFDAIQARELADDAAWGDYFGEALQYVELPSGVFHDEDQTPITTGAELQHYFASRPDVISALVTLVRLENMLTGEVKKNWKSLRASASGSAPRPDEARSGATPAAIATSVEPSSTAGPVPVAAFPAPSPSGATAH